MMLSSGWIRLWIVCSAIWFVATSAGLAYSVYGGDICYNFISVSTPKDVPNDQRKFLDDLIQEAKAKPLCGTFSYSTPLTLEQLAKKGRVTQVGIQWLEPNGWSFNDHDYLDVLDGHQITVRGITRRVARHVHYARFLNVLP